MTLDKIPLNKEVKILYNKVIDKELKYYLLEMGFIKNNKIMKIFNSPFKDPVIIRINNYNIALSKNILNQIEVI